MKTYTEKIHEQTVENKTKTIRVAECPWCSQRFEPEDAETIELNPRVNTLSVQQEIIERVIELAPNKDPYEMSMYEMDVHSAVVSEERKVDPNTLDRFTREVDLTEYLLRGDKLKEIIEKSLQNCGIVSDDKIEVCPNCAESIMGVE